MVKFEIVGLNDCPLYAKACKLADEIVGINTMVEINREALDKFHWTEYCEHMRTERGWDIKHSPVVFEVLVDRNGKAFLIGNCNDWCEFSAMYFDIYYDPSSSALHDMALANKARFGRRFDGEDRGDSAVFNVAIVNCPLKLLELILGQLLSPVSMIPAGVLLNISVFDETTESRVLQGVVMEAEDMASPFLFKISVSSNLSVAFYQCHLIIIGEDFSPIIIGEDLCPVVPEEGKDWITRVELKVTGIIEVINNNKVQLKDCRIIVGGEGPQCYIAEMIRKATSYSKSGPGRIIASGQYIALKAKCELSKIGNIPAGCISRIHAWGWPGETGAYIEVKDAVLKGAEVAIQGPGVEIPLAEVATNSDYIFKKFSKDFLRFQRKYLKYAINQPKRYMPLAESIISTIHIWLSSEQIVPPLEEESLKELPALLKNGPLPVLNVGVCCSPTSSFPEGTFMVQPSVCVNGHWQPLGLISEKTHKQVELEVNKLWLQREQLVYRDKEIATVIPDYDELMGPQDLEKKKAEAEANKAVITLLAKEEPSIIKKSKKRKTERKTLRQRKTTANASQDPNSGSTPPKENRQKTFQFQPPPSPKQDPSFNPLQNEEE